MAAATAYGSAENIRNYHLSGGVLESRDMFVSEDLVSEAMITQGRKFAFNLINSLLRGKYTVPFDTADVDPIIDEDSDTIASWWIENKRLKRLQSVAENPLNTEYAEAKERLEKIGESGQGLSTAVTTSSGYFTHNGFTPVFDVDGEFDQVLDEDLENQIASDRA